MLTNALLPILVCGRMRMMNDVTISTRGQVTLPEDLLLHLGANPGDDICFDKLPGGEIRIRAARAVMVEALSEAAEGEGPRPISIEEMNDAVDLGWTAET